MKRIYALFLLVFSTTLLKAQPALNTLGVPSSGEGARFWTTSLDSINPGAAGANRVWDFSHIVDYGLDNISYFVDPASIYMDIEPPLAVNFVRFSDHGWYRFTNTEQTYFGFGYIDYTLSYTDQPTSIKVPLAYNETFTDTFSGIKGEMNGYTLISGTINTTYDGYGTLITKNGTYANVVRLKSVELTLDSVMVDNFFDKSTYEVKYKTITYKYIYPGAMYPIFALVKEVVLYNTSYAAPLDPTLHTSYTATLYDQTPVLLANHHSEKFQVSAFPNPATDRITLSGLKKGDYATAIYAETGEKVMESNFRASGSYAMNVSDLPKGIYILQVLSNEGVSKTKIVKE